MDENSRFNYPQLSITERNGKVALWIGHRNVWDVPKKCATSDVLSAVKSAYEIGFQNAVDMIEARICGLRWNGRLPLDHPWVDKRE
jgi:hypothetical protein